MTDIIEREYGFPERFQDNPNLDFYVLSNEDIGFTANLVLNVNHFYQFALPYPADWDIDDDSMVLHALEFSFGHQWVDQTEGTGTEVQQLQSAKRGLNVFLAMLPEEFSDTIEGYSDTDDEEFKSQFAGPMFFGEPWIDALSLGTTPATYVKFHKCHVSAKYTPPKPLDLKMPMYITFINNSFDNAGKAIGFDKYEQVMMRVWYHLRKLSPSEKLGRKEAQMLWIRPGS